MPWDEALDTVLDMNKLVAKKNGMILIVNTFEVAAKEREAEMKAKDALMIQEPLLTKVFPISFAKIDDLKNILTEYSSDYPGSSSRGGLSAGVGGLGGLGEYSSSAYTQMALQSIKDNPKEILLGTMQKLDSYIFDVQKVPHLPGEYYLSADAKSIVIGNQRLTWPLVLGNLLYEIYRSLLLVGLLASIGVLLAFRKLKFQIKSSKRLLWLLLLPWSLGLIPGLLFYTETRFKIVSELLLIPFISLVFSVKTNEMVHGKEHALE